MLQHHMDQKQDAHQVALAVVVEMDVKIHAWVIWLNLLAQLAVHQAVVIVLLMDAVINVVMTVIPNVLVIVMAARMGAKILVKVVLGTVKVVKILANKDVALVVK